MIRVKFKNLAKSEIIEEVARERIQEAVERFPKSHPRGVVVTVAMENSPLQRGPDLFTVKTEVVGGRYHGLILEKSAHDLYSALAKVCDALLERFNRFSDRMRTKSLKQRRGFASNRRRDWAAVQGE